MEMVGCPHVKHRDTVVAIPRLSTVLSAVVTYESPKRLERISSVALGLTGGLKVDEREIYYR